MLTKAQREMLTKLPDSLGSGMPAREMYRFLNVPVSDPAAMLKRLMARGYVQREQPNEEWPYTYASTPAGRQALKEPTNTTEETK